MPARPLDALASRPAIRLLRYLSTHPGGLTGRQLATSAGVHPTRALEALGMLARLGLVQRRRAGRAYLYALNDDSYLVTDVIGPAFRNEEQWLDRLGAELFSTLQPFAHAVVLYGSWARGDAREHSDVDLLVVTVTPDGREEVERRADEVRGRLSDRFGRFVSILALTGDEVRRRLRAGDRLMRSVMREGRALAGRSLAEVATGA
ncbi:MAG: nucleotidyltransferase domain-containing protein [Armatimonadetes bacterium]|nr:nucleotidyltransferase domain-containing protein [Armatimonadota bacterium]